MRSVDIPDPALGRGLGAPVRPTPPAPTAHVCDWGKHPREPGYEKCPECGSVRRAIAAFALLASLTAHGAEICPSSICKPSPRYCEPLLIERVGCPVCPVCTTPTPPRRATPRPPARAIVKPVIPRSDPPAPRKGECPK